ncbi:hypothetical protein [Chitinophaga tropicalis]|uniref:Uncharacterized protein n=1 Tax=Chitinophaga tropicalis TaxID=2683588 RepID=A0A7K1U4S7_9BACT|nr:hypothetical protein [Chitinophaga tropicalis]MVT09362.1 hypothetical protein [Chitinophaga tropicalis]
MLNTAIAQDTLSDTVPQKEKVYNVKWKYELPISGAYILAPSCAFKELDKVAKFDESDVLKLNAADVNWFDRPIIFRDPAGFNKAHSLIK